MMCRIRPFARWIRCHLGTQQAGRRGPAGLSTRFVHDVGGVGLAKRAILTETLRELPYSSEFDAIKCGVPGTIDATDTPYNPPIPSTRKPTLPTLCHGCGAFAQTQDPNAPGFYDTLRNSVRDYLGHAGPDSVPHDELSRALKEADAESLSRLGIDLSMFSGTPRSKPSDSPQSPQSPLCDRCHKLVHHNEGTPISHPDIESLVETILESPHKKNHVYHIIDAADFPMSVLPRTRLLESLMPLRGRNRRAQRERWAVGKQIDVTFVITRADLLAPTQDQVHRLLPYLRDVLRNALGKTAQDARLGNVKPVSAKQSWWTRELKEEIWHRGGANWLLGKVNVGKSKFFETVFPKGAQDEKAKGGATVVGVSRASLPGTTVEEKHTKTEVQPVVEETGLLPPAFPEQMYPPMPTVSALPGTTAQPIRMPFGNRRGELIDLPGLPRSNLGEYVEPEFHSQLILQKRVKPNSTTTVKPGQSLLLGGIIRITPKENGPLMLMVNFTPFREHVTANKKVTSIQGGAVDNPMVENIGNDKAKQSIEHAGTFELATDITKDRAGPLTRKDAVGLKVDSLPFAVYGTDILVEGVGWIEVSAQVRRKDIERTDNLDPIEAEILGGMMSRFPLVDVHSPGGKFIASRRCINGFMHNRPKDYGKKAPRRTRSYKGGEEKKRKKAERRALKRSMRAANNEPQVVPRSRI